MRKLLVTGALLSAVLLATAACQTTGVTPSVSSSPTVQSATSATITQSATPTPTPSATPAELSVQGFWATVDEIGAATEAPPRIDKLALYGRGQAFQAWSAIVMQAYGRGEHQVGKTVIITSVAKAGATATQRIVTVCLDTSGVDVLDKSGKSIKRPDAVGRTTAVHTVEQDQKDSHWYVMTYEGRSGC